MYTGDNNPLRKEPKMTKFTFTRTDNNSIVAEIEAETESDAIDVYASRLLRDSNVIDSRELVKRWLGNGALTISV
jgi:hypothetical protein